MIGISPVTPTAPALNFAQKERDFSSPSIWDHLLQDNGDDLLKDDGDYLLKD